MKNHAIIKERYLQEPVNRRIGHLASNLARISTFLENSKNEEAIKDILEESKFFIEWTARDAPYEVQVMFSEIQPMLALWQRQFLQQKEAANGMEMLGKKTKNWSVYLVKFFSKA